VLSVYVATVRRTPPALDGAAATVVRKYFNNHLTFCRQAITICCYDDR